MYRYVIKDISKSRAEIASFLGNNLHKLDSPSAYLGMEINTIPKVWDTEKIRIILHTPVKYSDAISNKGVAILYNRLNEREDVICERGYMPESKLRKILIKKGYPTGFSLETKHQLKDFDCVGFSCYFELHFLNLIHTLYNSGIPLYASERGGNDYPIIVMGGVAAYSPSVVEEIVDMVFIGDGEEQMDILADKLAAYKLHKYKDKDAFLLDCAVSIHGCYVPKFYTFEYDGRWIKAITPDPQLKGLPYPVVKGCYDINKSTPFYKQILPETDDLLIGYGSVEIARGCYNSCRFCMASAIYKPYREYPFDEIDAALDKAMGYLGCNNIAPFSLNYSSYSERYRLLQVMAKKLKHISSSSQRMDTFSPILAEVLRSRGSKRATFAIEAGSQHMRNVINKEITNEHINTALKTLIEQRYSSAKIYMISGLPFETEKDALEIIDILSPIVEYAAEQTTNFKIRLSYTQFTAKPFTALQWADVTEVLDAKTVEGWGYYEKIKEGLKSIGIRASRSLKKTEHVLLQLFNRADRRITDGIVKAVIEDGLIYPVYPNNKRIFNLPNGTNATTRFETYINYLDSLCANYAKVSVKEYFTEIPTETILPWDMLSTGISKEWLASEYLNAKSAAVTPSCMAQCSNCGICSNWEIREQYADPRPKYTDIHYSNDISAEELKSLVEFGDDKVKGKLLVTLKIPERSKYTEPTVLKRKLILAFNNVSIFVDSIMLQSELIQYKGYRYGAEFAILSLRSDTVRRKPCKDLYDKINDKLEGLLEVTGMESSLMTKKDTLSNVAEYALYKLKVKHANVEELTKGLDIANSPIKFEQPVNNYRQTKSARIIKNEFIPFVKAVRNDDYSVFVYALVPLDINVYYLIKELLGNRSVLRLMSEPLERVAFISDLRSIHACRNCNQSIEATDRRVSVENLILETYNDLCVSCLIDEGLI